MSDIHLHSGRNATYACTYVFGSGNKIYCYLSSSSSISFSCILIYFLSRRVKTRPQFMASYSRVDSDPQKYSNQEKWKNLLGVRLTLKSRIASPAVRNISKRKIPK